MNCQKTIVKKKRRCYCGGRAGIYGPWCGDGCDGCKLTAENDVDISMCGFLHDSDKLCGHHRRLLKKQNKLLEQNNNEKNKIEHLIDYSNEQEMNKDS